MKYVRTQAWVKDWYSTVPGKGGRVSMPAWLRAPVPAFLFSPPACHASSITPLKLRWQQCNLPIKKSSLFFNSLKGTVWNKRARKSDVKKVQMKLFHAGTIAAAAAVALSSPAAASGAVELTDATFDKEVFNSGKNAFVKFLAPW